VGAGQAMLKGTVSGWEDEFFLEVDGGGSYTECECVQSSEPCTSYVTSVPPQ
jgi:hypothetical protein